MDAPGSTPARTGQYGAIPPDHYWRDDALAAEMAHVFRPSWLCVAFTDDLKTHNDFVTTQIGPHSIVVQNFRGELKAFRNVCSHRFSRIQTEACGNRRLQCPYHNWLYDAQGVPRGIPDNETAFGLSEADKEKLALTAYRLETCGRFVFVNMTGDAPPLRDFLGRVYDDLEHFSAACPERIRSNLFEWDVNWKVAFENAAENYHTRMVHPDTLAPTLGDDLDTETFGDHTVLHRSLSDKTRAWWDRVAGLVKLEASQRYPLSVNYVVFPNIVIMATAGASFVFQTFEPLGPTRFRFRSTYFLADGKPGPARDAVAASLADFSEQVMGEDHDICMNVQNGLKEGLVRPPLLGRQEGRVRHFQQAYARHIGIGHV